MLKVGLTGNIAAGKSEVEKILKEMGFFVIDLDIVSHDILETNEKVRCKILEEFNTTERTELSKIVFQNPQKKKILEKIIHPVIKESILSLFKEKRDMIIISGALLYEAGFDNLFDKIIYISAPYEIRLKRLIERNNYTTRQAQLRLNTQRENHKQKADYIIDNTASKEELKEQIKKVMESLI